MTEIAKASTGFNGSQRKFLLASLRTAAANLRTYQLEIDMIGVALRDELMSIETACELLDDAGLLRWLPPPTEIDGEVAP